MTGGRIVRKCSTCGAKHPLGARCPQAQTHGWGRKRTPRVYDDPEYRRNRPIALERAGDRCEAVDRGLRCPVTVELSVDHIRAAALGGGHELPNLQVLCQAHARLKNAADAKRVRQARAGGAVLLPARGHTS